MNEFLLYSVHEILDVGLMLHGRICHYCDQKICIHVPNTAPTSRYVIGLEALHCSVLRRRVSNQNLHKRADTTPQKQKQHVRVGAGEGEGKRSHSPVEKQHKEVHTMNT